MEGPEYMIVDKYGSMLFRICIVILANREDAEDAVQETFLRYLKKAPDFSDSEHEKAWLIHVATNICKDIRRFNFRNKHADIDELSEFLVTGHREENTGILEEVMKLKPKYREMIVLFYIEGYKIREIAEICGISAAAAKKRLQYARDSLRMDPGGGCVDHE